MTILALNDGRVVQGLVQKETDSAVTLRTINDTVVVAKSDIEERKLSELSLMPEGQLNQLTPDELMRVTHHIVKPGGNAVSQGMGGFTKDRWSGNDHLWWTGAKPNDKLELELPVAQDGTYDIELVLGMARDYGIVQILIDGELLGDPIDCFNEPDVITTGVISLPAKTLTKGPHKLGLQIVGANAKAAKAFMVGVDYVRLVAKK